MVTDAQVMDRSKLLGMSDSAIDAQLCRSCAKTMHQSDERKQETMKKVFEAYEESKLLPSMSHDAASPDCQTDGLTD